MAINGIELAVGQKWRARDGTVVQVTFTCQLGQSEGFAVVQPFRGVEYKVFLDGRVHCNRPGANRAGDLIDLTWAPSCESAAKDDEPFPPLLQEFIAENPYGAQSALDQQQEAGEYTGGSVSYYRVHVENPTHPDLPAYDAECNDIIEVLGMNYAEGNAFKAIWRRCAARKGLAKRGYQDGLYDAEKIEFFGARLVAQEKGGA